MKCEYANDGVRITAPGKFEGCPVFVSLFWGQALEGFADGDDGKVYTFKFKNADFERGGGLVDCFGPEIKAWLGRSRVMRLWEDEQGFVHCG